MYLVCLENKFFHAAIYLNIITLVHCKTFFFSRKVSQIFLTFYLALPFTPIKHTHAHWGHSHLSIIFTITFVQWSVKQFHLLLNLSCNDEGNCQRCWNKEGIPSIINIKQKNKHLRLYGFATPLNCNFLWII